MKDKLLGSNHNEFIVFKNEREYISDFFFKFGGLDKQQKPSLRLIVLLLKYCVHE
jgi:hypothetical protein